MSYLPKRALNLKKGPIATGCWGVQRRMGINSHPQILLCQEQVQRLRHSQTPHRDGTVNQHSSTLHFQFIPTMVQIENVYKDQLMRKTHTALKTLEKAGQWMCGRFFIKTIRRSPRNGLSSQSSQSVWRELKPFLIQYLSAVYLQWDSPFRLQ